MPYYISDSGKAVNIFNKRPRNLSGGGLIKDSPKIKEKEEDTLSSYLEYGSLVVPVPVVQSGVMDLYKGRITGQKQLCMTQLGRTVVMPGEYVINKKYATKVENFLKKKGITLPIRPNQRFPKFV
jgi:hypothetical protein